jgi:hypothetical protein
MKTIALLGACTAFLFSRPSLAEEGAAAPAPVPKGGRTLGIDVCVAADNDYGRAFALSRAAGMDATQLSVYWDDIEKEPGTFAPAPNYLAIANAFYPAQKTPLHLVIAVIDTTKKRVPKDLAGTPLDDPHVIDRFRNLLDYVFSQVPALDAASLSIGNEIDGTLGSKEKEWKAYRAFFEAARLHVKKKRPGLTVGVKLMFGGLMKEGGPARALAGAADAVMVNHYPLNADFTVKDPAAIASDFDAVVTAFPGRPVFFTELGYPSGAACRSTEALQETFVRRMFGAWDRHAGAVRYVNLCILTDRPGTFVRDAGTYYGLGSPAFLDFLRTLGLRTHDGRGGDKPAFRALKEETKARGW